MFPLTPNYSQQLLAYLQAWQQLLQQWAAMTPGLPFLFAPSAMPTAPMGPPFMPPPTQAPPVAPAPADYTQQLCSYLQAWRLYLEQMVGARPGAPQASSPQQPTAQPTNDGGNARPPRPPSGPNPPGDGTGSETSPGSDADTASNLDWPRLNLRPENYYRSEIARKGFDPTGPFDREAEPRVLNPPDYAFGYESFGPRGTSSEAAPTVSSAPSGALFHLWGLPAEQASGTPFQSAIKRLKPNVSPQPGEETPSP